MCLMETGPVIIDVQWHHLLTDEIVGQEQDGFQLQHQIVNESSIAFLKQLHFTQRFDVHVQRNVHLQLPW